MGNCSSCCLLLLYPELWNFGQLFKLLFTVALPRALKFWATVQVVVHCCSTKSPEILGNCSSCCSLLLYPELWNSGQLFKLLFTVALHPQRSYIRTGLLGTRSPRRPPRLSHSSWALNFWATIQCCSTSIETVRTIRDREPRTSTSNFTQLLSSVIHVQVQCCFTSTETVRTGSPGRSPRLSVTQFLSSVIHVQVQCCSTSIETVRTVRDRTVTSTFTQLLSCMDSFAECLL